MNNESDLWNCETYLGSLLQHAEQYRSDFSAMGPVHAVVLAVGDDAVHGQQPDGRHVQRDDIDPRRSAHRDESVPECSRARRAVGAFSTAPASVTVTTPAGDQYLNKKSTTTPARTWQDITGSSTRPSPVTPPSRAESSTATSKDRVTGARRSSSGRPIRTPPTTGGNCTSRTRTARPATATWLSGAARGLEQPDGQLHHQLQGDPELDREHRAESVPAAASRRKHPVLQLDSDRRAGLVHTPGATSTRTITNADQRFWKEYIDFAIGVWQDPYGNLQTPGNPTCSYGPDFTCGSSSPRQRRLDHRTRCDGCRRRELDRLRPTIRKRPRHRFWFGPMTMIQYMLDTGLCPGTAQDVSMIAGQARHRREPSTDIQNNHPNDLVSLIMFARPTYSGDPTGVGHVPTATGRLTNNYSNLINALVVSAQQRHHRRHALGPERSADAARSRRLRQQHRHQLRSDAGLQPAQQQLRRCRRQASAARAARAPRSW